MESMEKICEECQKPFNAKWDKSKYCSRKCSSLSQRSRVTLICQECGCHYTVPLHRKDSKYCSKLCLYGGSYVEKPKGYWRDWDNLKRELESIIVGDVFPSTFTIRKQIGSYALRGIEHFGGLGKVAKKLGCRRTGRSYISSDGHFVRSGYELLLDEYLFARGIPHEVDGFVPDSKYRFDFKVKDTYIEIWGFNRNRKYNDNKVARHYQAKRKNKELHYKEKGLHLVSFEENFFNRTLVSIEAQLDSIFSELGFDVSKKDHSTDLSSVVEVCAIWTESQVIDWIKSYIEEHEVFPAKRVLESQGDFDKVYVIKRYGGFTYFRKKLGHDKHYQWSIDRVVNHLTEITTKTGFFPTQREIPKKLAHGAAKFGGLRAMKGLVEEQLGHPCRAKSDKSECRYKTHRDSIML